MWRKLMMAWLFLVSIQAVDPTRALGQSSTTIANGASANPGYIYAWTSRNADRAVAFRIYNEGGVVRGVFRQFVLLDEEGEKSFDAKPTVLKFGTTTLLPKKSIPFTLTDYPGRPGSYTIHYQHTDGVKELGWLRFNAGHGERASSDVVIRLNRDVVTPPVAITTDPCIGPPGDDIGEEELIANSSLAGEANVPGKSLNFKPLVSSPSPIISPSTVAE